jgi:hypothetical protein
MKTTKGLTQFRDRLYRSLPGRGDAAMDLIDALSGNQNARSVVELSMNPAFRRKWPSVSRTIDRFFTPSAALLEYGERTKLERRLRRATKDLLEQPRHRQFWLFGVDGTPNSRPHARCLEDRSWVHQCDPIGWGAPVTIGHQYSLAVAFPERSRREDPAWVLPLSSRRVPSHKTANEVGQEQIRAIIDDPKAPWYEEPAVVLGDSAYSSLPFLGPLGGFENLVVLARVRSNRVFYKPPDPTTRCWFGPAFRLADPTTWTEPAETSRFCYVTRGGKRIEARVQRFTDLRMRGTRQWKMHQRPFDLLRVVFHDEQGQLLPGRPMWLMIEGAIRATIRTDQALAAYLQRFDQEHFHRFCRQRLLFDAYQTPETEHEENWIMLNGLAYSQLFAARHLASALPRPWEPQVDVEPTVPLSPSLVQRDFPRLLRQLGTPARPPKPRNLNPGRRQGERQGLRPRRKVVRKAKSPPQKASAPASSAT